MARDNDNVGCIIAIVVLIVIAGAVYSINRKSNERKAAAIAEKERIEAMSTGLDEYIIVDKRRCAHSKKCYNLSWYKDSVAYSVNYIDTFTIKDSDFDYVCVECVGSKEYKHLMRICRKHRSEDSRIKVVL